MVWEEASDVINISLKAKSPPFYISLEENDSILHNSWIL